MHTHAFICTWKEFKFLSFIFLKNAVADITTFLRSVVVAALLQLSLGQGSMLWKVCFAIFFYTYENDKWMYVQCFLILPFLNFFCQAIRITRHIMLKKMVFIYNLNKLKISLPIGIRYNYYSMVKNRNNRNKT